MIARVLLLVLIFTCCIKLVLSFDSRNVVFVIVSQPDPYHMEVTEKLKQDIEKQIWEIEKRKPQIKSTTDLKISGAWTIVPILRELVKMYGKNTEQGTDVRWVVFLEPHTVVRCKRQLDTLSSADRQQDTMWIGYPLTDEEPSVIHHYTIYEELEEDGGFVYPNFASGFAMRMSLVKTLQKRLRNCDRTSHEAHSEKFAIDASYELAQLIYRDGEGPLLTAELNFCIIPGDNCATYPRHFYSCGSPIPEKSIFFAVKTWSRNHETRAQVVKKTWGSHVSNLLFYSDLTDLSLPSINVGIPNTDRGHCTKTMVILKDAVKRVRSLPDVRWIFLADDDTILGVQRLCEVLSCFGGGDNATMLGERYRHGSWRGDQGLVGYDYITSGGGVALSTRAAELLSSCSCHNLDDPDDMILGECAASLQIDIIHSPLFHQARPQDYPRELLVDRPVSFHRHSATDPHKLYSAWFYHDDLPLRKKTVKDEL